MVCLVIFQRMTVLSRFYEIYERSWGIITINVYWLQLLHPTKLQVMLSTELHVFESNIKNTIEMHEVIIY